MMEISELVKKHKLTDEHGNTVLHLAMENKKFTQKGMIDVLKLLLDSGADPNVKNKNDETVLHLAVKNRTKKVIHFLLTRITDIDSAFHSFINHEYKKFQELSSKGNSHELDSKIKSIETESAHFAEWLISKGFDFDCKNKKNKSAILLAIEHNLEHILPALLKSTKDINFLGDKNRTLLHMFFDKRGGIRYNNRNSIAKRFYSKRYGVDIVKILLDRGISVDVEDAFECTPIRLAIYVKEDIDIIEILLEHSTNINQRNSKGETLFKLLIKQWASSKYADDYYMKIAQALIAKGADINIPDKDGMTPLSQVIVMRFIGFAVSTEEYENHSRELARYTDAPGIQIGQMHANYNKPLSTKPILKSNLKIVEFLEENGADFRVRTEDGKTLIHLLVKDKNCMIIRNNEAEMKLLKLLIGKGCQMDAKDRDGTTPLHYAAMYSDVYVVKMFIDHGARVSSRNCEMETPLHFATRNPKVEAVAELLLKYGANVNAKDSKGQTPLHKIALESSCAGLGMLLQYGADVMARDLENHTALGCARSRDLADLQQKREAWVDRRNRKSYWCVCGRCNEDDDDDDDDDDRSLTIDDCPLEDMASDIVMFLTSHSMKLKAVDLPWDKEINGNLGVFDEDQSTEELLAAYYNEVQKLRSILIDNYTSIYDFLHMNPNYRRTFINNEKLQELLHSPNQEKEFGKFTTLILASYAEAITRRTLLEPARKAWLELTQINLPAICLDLIFSFLSNADLFLMIENDKGSD